MQSAGCKRYVCKLLRIHLETNVNAWENKRKYSKNLPKLNTKIYKN